MAETKHVGLDAAGGAAAALLALAGKAHCACTAALKELRAAGEQARENWQEYLQEYESIVSDLQRHGDQVQQELMKSRRRLQRVETSLLAWIQGTLSIQAGLSPDGIAVRAAPAPDVYLPESL